MVSVLLFMVFFGARCTAYMGDDNSCPNSDPELWKPEWMIGDDLLCDCKVLNTDPDEAFGEGPNLEQKEDYCTCKAYPKWRGTEVLLLIEYISVLGQNLVISDTVFNDSKVYKIQHSAPELTKIPSNLCNWDNMTSVYDIYRPLYDEFEIFWKDIVIIDFSASNIETLVDLNCLERLHTLNLNQNRLTHVSNTSLNHLKQLREVSFAQNWIKTIDPAITSSLDLALLRIDFSYNDMTEIDISNMYSHQPFCHFNYKNNSIEGMTNLLDVEVKLEYGPGFVNLQNNVFETFPDLEEILNLENIAELGNVLSFGFDLQGIQLKCDCNLQPFRSLSDNVIKTLWRDYFRIVCKSPEEHAGKLAFDIPRDQLICPFKDVENVTVGCEYRDVPEHDTLYVNCSYAKLDRLPEAMPISRFSKQIHLNVSHNHIRNIENVTYLKKISVLDISYNDIQIIDHPTALQLENASFIDLSNNERLRVIPKVLQYRNSCTVNGENDVILCDCDTLWIITWLEKRQCHNVPTFKCEVHGHGIMPATFFTEVLVECKTEETVLLFLSAMLGGTIALLILVASLTYHFKYELLILYLRSRAVKKSTVLPHYNYDVYVILDDENDSVRQWVSLSVVPSLEKIGYKVFLPYRDIELPGVKSNDIIDKINKSRVFLVILTHSYLAPEDIKIEWKYAWNMLKQDGTRKIVLLNFDFISSFDVSHQQIRAYLRVGSTISFMNFERDMLKRIILQIGPAQKMFSQKERTTNAKTFPTATSSSAQIISISDNTDFNYVKDQNIDNDDVQKTIHTGTSLFDNSPVRARARARENSDMSTEGQGLPPMKWLLKKKETK